MFDDNMTQMAVLVMVALAAGGVVYVMIYPYLTGEKKGDRRLKSVSKGGVADRSTRVSAIETGNARRKQVQETLKELESQQKAKTTLTLRMRLERSGLNWSPQGYYIVSGIFALVAIVLVLISGTPIYVAAAAGAAAGLGLPRWLLGYLAKRRQKKFIEEFVNAIDIIVRGVKSGLPLNDCIKIIAAEVPDPVKSEFQEVVEQLRIGLPISQALEKMYQRIPLEEVNFFSIVIAIQQKAGGNLAEALGNLSGVLRDRRKLKAKVQAFSAEAKSSAIIIGSLPIALIIIIYIMTPDYISVLWTHPTGNLLLAGCGVWMMLGVIIMAKMINFDY